MSKLNLGCGRDIRSGYVNLDRFDLKGVDVVHDLNTLPLPFASGEFDEVLCLDVLEHVDFIPLMEEIHRLLTPNGTVRIRVPHFTSVNNYRDPTHKHRFSIETFDFLVRGTGTPWVRGYYFGYHFSGAEQKTITFQRGKYVWNHPVQWLVNRSAGMQRLYEETGLCYLYPALNVEITLRK